MDFLNHIPLIGPALGVIIPFLIVLSVVVAIHELGHLMVGRWCGIKAEVFSIGFGKVLFSRTDRHGTQWQVAALPLGGYVKFLGDMDPASAGQVDDEELPDGEHHRAFHNASLLRRALTVLAGPVANFLLSIVLIFGLALYLGKSSDEPVVGSMGDLTTAESGFALGDRIISVGDKPVETFNEALDALLRSNGAPVEVTVLRNSSEVAFTTHYALPPLITGALPDGAAMRAGLRPGDVITRIDGREITSSRDLQLVVAALPHHQEITVTVKREEKVFDASFTPKVVERTHPETGERTAIPQLGVGLEPVAGIAAPMIAMGPVEAMEVSVRRVWRVVTDTLIFIHGMIFEGADTSHLAGPIGIAKHSATAASHGLDNFIFFMAFVSTAIGLFNLFPIPILDGGHLCFYLFEALRGRPSNEAIVRYSNLAGLSLLLLLMVFVTINNDLGLGEWLTQD